VSLVSDNVIKVGRHEITVYAEKDAANIPWAKHDVDIVFECTGFYLSTEKASAHLKGGARKVIISAPAKDSETHTVVVGVNHDTLKAEETIVSNASCTTNCLAPLTKAVDMSHKIIAGLMSTTHAATSTQRVADFFGGGKNRATLNNVIPASTGAAIAVGKVLPHLNGKLNGTALRVPTDTGSVVGLYTFLKVTCPRKHWRSRSVKTWRRSMRPQSSSRLLTLGITTSVRRTASANRTAQ
jgi:glyceraldehyde 3-phosphate dehydrogenase